jgi:PAS domain S-box-containing protein
MEKRLFSQANEAIRDELTGQQPFSPEFQVYLEQLQRFRTLLDHANDIILLSSLDSQRIVDANASASQHLGYPYEMLVGMPVENIVDFECLSWPEESGEEVECRAILTRLQRRQGGVLPVEMLLSMEEFGGTAYVVIVARDITERLRAEAVLKRSEWEKALILESTQELIVFHDIEMGIVWANRAAAESIHLTREQLIGRSCWELWHQRSSPCLECPVVNSIRTGQPHKAEVVSPDGKVWLIRSYPARNAEGEIEGAVEMCLDITDRKRAEEALEQSQKQFRDMVETINEWVWEVDSNGVYTYASPRIRELLGYEPEEVVGKTPFDLMPKSEAEKVSGILLDLMKKKEPFSSLENTNRHKDGHLVVLETSGVPFFDEQNNLLGYRGVDRDVTVRKQAEHALRESDRMKTEFISTAAHELRTPLTSILGFSQILLNPETVSAAEQKEFMAYIHQRAKALSDMVADLLDISRIESGQGLALRRELCTAGELVIQLAPFIQSSHEACRFELAVSSETAPLWIDKGKLVEVFENLLSNAVKYSSPASPIRIAGEIAGENYRFSVADRGIGMTPEQAVRVFDKFYRADASDTAIGGLGLGMSIVRNIVEAHGGRIWVESEPSRGTTVQFLLPLGRPELSGNGNKNEDNPHR